MSMELAQFQDRAEAGRVLADRLTKYSGWPDVVVLALPRGGVPVGFQVARSLGAPLEVLPVRKLGVPGHQELERRERAYRGQRPPPELTGKVVIVVDDGLATGATMWAAVAAIRRQQPARIVVAVPVAAASTCQALEQAADEVICASTPALFVAVGQAYRNFAQTTDEEVRTLLDAARATNDDHAAGS